jgi:hypothetical protein
MLGFVAALISEASTHQAVFSQIAGRYADLELVEKPVGVSSLGFAMLVALITVGSLAPKMLEGVEVRGWGIRACFAPAALHNHCSN